jgi:uncharacterized protein (DUF1330 family)
MSAYLIADIDVLDADGFGEYRAKVPGVIAAHGGKYLARGGTLEVLEGSWSPGRCVIVEFPSMAALKAFYNAPEYQALLKLRKETTRTNLIALEGL